MQSDSGCSCGLSLSLIRGIGDLLDTLSRRPSPIVDTRVLHVLRQLNLECVNDLNSRRSALHFIHWCVRSLIVCVDSQRQLAPDLVQVSSSLPISRSTHLKPSVGPQQSVWIHNSDCPSQRSSCKSLAADAASNDAQRLHPVADVQGSRWFRPWTGELDQRKEGVRRREGSP